MISIIAAVAENRAIGKNNKLLAYLPNDLKWFKKNTTGKDIIMGKNTFLSLPNGALPNRKNIVISDVENESFAGCITVHSIQAAIDEAKSEEVFVIGGASIYKQFIDKADKLYLTKIYHHFEADAFFPEIDFTEWNELERINNYSDEKHAYPYTFYIFERKVN